MRNMKDFPWRQEKIENSISHSYKCGVKLEPPLGYLSKIAFILAMIVNMLSVACFGLFLIKSLASNQGIRYYLIHFNNIARLRGLL